VVQIQYFIRQATGSTVARRMRYLHEHVEKACKHVVEDLRKDGGLGGVIAVDNQGNGTVALLQFPLRIVNAWIVAMPLNCPGMYRGVIRKDGVPKTAIFMDDVL
jgi:beta-aspartyl-peptidase (threonine type)